MANRSVKSLGKDVFQYGDPVPLDVNFSDEGLPRNEAGLPFTELKALVRHRRHKEKPEICEVTCGNRSESCTISPDRCPIAINGSVDID